MTEEKIWKTLKWICIIICLCCITCLLFFFINSDSFKYTFTKKGLSIKSLTNVHPKDGKLYANLETNDLLINKKMWCISTNEETNPNFDNPSWQQVIDNKCDVEIHDGDKYLYIRDSRSVGEKNIISDYVSYISKMNIEKTELKLIKDQTEKINVNIECCGSPDKTLKYVSTDENIAKVVDGEIIGIGDGEAQIIVSDNYTHSECINVKVTSLVTLPKINNSKPFISNKQYTQEEAKILDDYLFYQIDEAGYETRAGVVAAARFLTLELKYRIPYFIENGRLTHFNHRRPYCDGEGRYYHRGLYLSEDKFAILEKSVAGPAMWGAYIREWSEDNGIIRNGLDCSGFVCWCLINGGFDFGDIGGGLSEDLPTLSDRGVSHRITMDYLNTKTAKAGDLIGYDGHIGIIVGVDNENELIYVADELYHSKGSWVQEYTYRGLVYSHFTHIYDYTDEYKNEGNYKSMW